MVIHLFSRPTLTIEFPDTAYEPGQMVPAVVKIDSGDESHHIRHGTLSLHYTVRYSESSETIYAVRLGDTALLQPPRPRSSRTTREITEEYVMSSTEFIGDEHVGPGESEHDAELNIGPDYPPNWDRGNVTATLVAALDIAGERDVSVNRDIHIVYGREMVSQAAEQGDG